MRRLLPLALLCSTIAATSAPALAQGNGPGITPGGPYVTPDQTVRIDALMSYEELTKTLQGIAKRNDNVEIESIGRSSEGRDIWLAKVGDPDNTPVMIITQQHGDEPLGTESAIELIKQLAGGKGSAILDELYVLIVPRVNVDGAEPQDETGVPERGNTDYLAPRVLTSQGIFTTELGDLELWSYDINRYHFATPVQSDILNWQDSLQYMPASAFDTNPVPEAVAVLNAYFENLPIWVIDVHHQGFHITNPDADDDPAFYREDRRVTGGVLWPLNEEAAPEVVDLSKQMAVAMKLESLQYGHIELTRYDSTSGFAGIARNAYGLYGTERLANGEDGPLGGSVLLEIDGQTEGSVATALLGQKGSGHLTKGISKMLWAVMEQTADGSLFQIDPELAEAILIDDQNFRNPLTEE